MFDGCKRLAAVIALTLTGCGGGHHQPSATRAAQDATVPAAVISGRLTDRNSGVALAQATVIAQNAQNAIIYAKAVTGADGGYSLAHLPLGVAIRVVSQPVTGAVAYGTEVSDPVTLVKDTPAPPVNLACAQVQHTGRVEGARAPQAVPGRKVALVQNRDLGGGTFLKTVIRFVRPAGDGSFQFDSVPPGSYEVHFLGHGRRAGRGHRHRPHPHRRRHPQRRRGPSGNPRIVAITVQAGSVAHVNWPANPALGAGPEATEQAAAQEEADLDQDEVHMEAEEEFELP